MAITRLGVASPAANTPAQLISVLNSHLVSVIVANTSAQATPLCKVDVYVIPQGATTSADYAYIVANLTIGVGQSFETFKFAVNPSDQIWVKSTTEDASFSCFGLLQSEDVGPSDIPAVFRNKTLRGINNVIYLDKGTTAQRDVSAEVGYVRFNTDFDALEVKTSAGWKTITAV